MLSDRHPDIAVALKAMPRDARGGRPPSLAVEVVSPGAAARRRDYALKRGVSGLRPARILDRRSPRPQGDGPPPRGRPLDRAAFVGDQAAEGLVLPGLRVPLPDLWAAGEAPDDAAPDEEPPVA